jgi:hypothetical protein
LTVHGAGAQAVGMKSQLLGSVLVWFLAAAPITAQDAKLAADRLKYGRDFYSKVHLVAITSLDFGGGEPIQFKYDRYPDGGPERIQAGDGEFARTKGKGWLRSNDWGETGSPADAQISKRLNNWVGLIEGQLSAQPALEFVTKKSADGREDLVFKENKQDAGEAPRFTFGKYKNDKSDTQPLLSEFSGVMRLGARDATVTIRFSHLVSVKMNIVEAKDGSATARPATPSPEQEKGPAAGPAVKLLDGKLTLAVPSDFVREPVDPKKPKTLAHFSCAGGAWGEVLRGSNGLTPEKLPDYLKMRVAEYSKGFDWLPKDSPLTWLRKELVNIDGRPWADWRYVPMKKGSKDYRNSPIYTRFLTTSYKGQLLEITFTTNLETAPELKQEIDRIMDSVRLEE